MQHDNLQEILRHFAIKENVCEITQLGNGLINDTYKITTDNTACADYVIQRINKTVFGNVELLQHNIIETTRHIRKKLEERNESDIDRKVLRLIPADNGKTFYCDNNGNCWRVTVYIPDAVTKEDVTPENSYQAGRAFGDFEYMLCDMYPVPGYTIPDFHNMEFRMEQLREAVRTDSEGRVKGVKDILDFYEKNASRMCMGQRMLREGKLPLRICHCDTKINNMMFDASNGEFLLVIDLDTVMPSFIFSDYGDFLRSAANLTNEDDPETNNVGFNESIFKAFSYGYMETAGRFITDTETEMLPYAAELFPFMQSVRFMWDYLCGDHYWKCKYPEHNLDRARNQLKLYTEICAKEKMMDEYIKILANNKTKTYK